MNSYPIDAGKSDKLCNRFLNKTDQQPHRKCPLNRPIRFFRLAQPSPLAPTQTQRTARPTPLILFPIHPARNQKTPLYTAANKESSKPHGEMEASPAADEDG